MPLEYIIINFEFTCSGVSTRSLICAAMGYMRCFFNSSEGESYGCGGTFSLNPHILYQSAHPCFDQP